MYTNPSYKALGKINVIAYACGSVIRAHVFSGEPSESTERIHALFCFLSFFMPSPFSQKQHANTYIFITLSIMGLCFFLFFIIAAP